MSALMLQGCSSSAGKSLLTTALARAFARRGVRVAPFKAQNMSNNARVIAGGEIGVAQYLQALAALAEPDVRMNPVLIKPEGETRSQVVVNGTVDLKLSRTPWRERAPFLWPHVDRALRSLLAEYELVLIEGAGSPAETNLATCDLANLRTAEAARAPIILIADIDRGGAFAHLYGTWSLMPASVRAYVRGFVLNKFRGDPALLAPAPAELEELTHVPTICVFPWLEHSLPDEDGVTPPPRRHDRPRVAIIQYPTASNLDEFKLLEGVADVVFARSPAELADASLVILPGSKHVAADLDWLRLQRLETALAERVAAGKRVLAICGGLQMIGERTIDAAGVDGTRRGLGLMPLRTTFRARKTVAARTARFSSLPDPWSPLSGLSVSGYEIRHGESEGGGLPRALSDGLGFVDGPVLAVYLHGLLEDPDIVEALLGRRPASTEAEFDRLGDAAVRHFDLDHLAELAGLT